SSTTSPPNRREPSSGSDPLRLDLTGIRWTLGDFSENITGTFSLGVFHYVRARFVRGDAAVRSGHLLFRVAPRPKHGRGNRESGLFHPAPAGAGWLDLSGGQAASLALRRGTEQGRYRRRHRGGGLHQDRCLSGDFRYDNDIRRW